MTLGSEFQKNRKKRRKKYFCTLRSYEATHVLWASWGSIPSASLELHQLQYHFRGRQMVITSGWLIWQYDHVSHEVGRSTWPSTVLWMPPVPPTGRESLSKIFIHMHRVYTNINDLNIIYVYICILHKCSAMLQIVDVFKCFWLTLMELYGKYVESMWKSLFLCPWRSNALHTRLLCQSLEAIPLGLIQLLNLFDAFDAYREVDTNGQRSWMPRIWNQAWVTS